jgi:uncharacterized protein YceK
MKRASFLIIVVILLSGCSNLFKAQYKISGTASSVNVTLANGHGGTEQYTSVKLPYSYDLPTSSGSFLYCSAQNNDSSGYVQVDIVLWTGVAATGSASGAYCIATASYTP